MVGSMTERNRNDETEMNFNNKTSNETGLFMAFIIR